jgi:hypothetical protein
MKNSIWVLIGMALVLVGSVVRKEPLSKDALNIITAILYSAYFICKAIEKQKQ